MPTRIRFLTAGESHGPKLTAIVEGVPAGLALDRGRIDLEMARRQKGFGSGGRMRIEHDRARITAGIAAGRTTGAPIALEIENRDHESWRDRDIEPMVTPRPGHADLAGAIKYGHADLRPGLERASARETAARVACGAICRQLLSHLGVTVGGYTRSIGPVAADLEDDTDEETYARRFETALGNDLACPDVGSLERMREAIDAASGDGDTLGGIIEVVVTGLPPGLGSYVHWDRRLDARLAMAMVSIQAMKGVEIGPAFSNAALRGTGVHDAILRQGDALVRGSNRAGGIEGGITNGRPVVIRVAMKPISTTRTPLPSVNLVTGDEAEAAHERSDVCAVPRAVPVAEAMAAILIADALLEKLGGDSIDEILPRLESLRTGRLDELHLDGKPWRFGYDD
jgi:chorismate synthase